MHTLKVSLLVYDSLRLTSSHFPGLLIERFVLILFFFRETIRLNKWNSRKRSGFQICERELQLLVKSELPILQNKNIFYFAHFLCATNGFDCCL